MADVTLGDNIQVVAFTRNAAGELQDADSPPTYIVYANGVAVLTGQTFTDRGVGSYYDLCAITTGNGFAVGDLIDVVGTATVDTVTDSGPLYSGRVLAPEAEEVAAEAAAAATASSSESGLSLTRNDLRNAVGFYAGFGLDYSDYTTDQLSIVDRIIDIGSRKFYHPPPIPGDRTTHVWSFLQPLGRLSLMEDVVDYDLPNDYAGLIGKLHLSTDDTIWSEIEVTNVARILSKRQGGLSTFTGRPELVAVQVIKSNGETPTRYTLMVYPTPDQSYTLSFPYTSNPFQLTASQSYPLGGQPHAETLRMACLAAAEQNLNDERGVQNAEFMERLMASVHFDRQSNGPKSLGYNGDRSVGSPNGSWRRGFNEVTYMGTLYDGSD